MADPVLQFHRLSVRYERFTLEPVSFDLAAGERIALVGPNGAGKSTMLKAALGRVPESTGHVLVRGRSAADDYVWARQQVGLLPETLMGFGWMPVRDHLRLLSAFQPTWDRDYATSLLERFELDPEAKLGTLSRGQQVKLMFVAAEAFRPPVLLLDEPTSGLDPVVRTELLRTVDACIAADPERAVLFSTHILEDVSRLADRVIILKGGSVRADARTSALLEQGDGRSLAEILYNRLETDEPAARSGTAGR